MQAIYHIARNYQHYEPDFTHNGRKKTKVRIVDFQPTESAATAFRHRYRFLDWDRTETCFSGFDSVAVDWLMR
jgi:proline dehydrogenase